MAAPAGGGATSRNSSNNNANVNTSCPPRLESLAVDRYLLTLQDCCAGFVQLARLDSRLLSRVRGNIVAKLKEELNSHLFGTASSSLRQEMIGKVLSGRFPTSVYHNQYETSAELGGTGGEAFFETDQDAKTMEEIRQCGKKCNSVCCTGAFVAETMLAVLVSEDVRELNFDVKWSPEGIFWNKNKLVRKYVNFQVPAVIAHYTKALRDSKGVTTAKLERLYVKGTDIPSRQFATKKNHFEVLTNFTELVSYLEIPGMLSEAAGGQQYGAYSEHLVLSLGEMFSLKDSFPRLTEIVLGREACNTSLRMLGPRNRDINSELFRGIGRSCPNLKVLDVSGALCLSAECLLFLFFHDAYQTLHKYVYLPQLSVNFEDKVVQNDDCSLDEIRRHDELPYCPWCEDDWCANGIRQGLEWSDVHTTVVDERVYDGVRRMFGDRAKKFLVNVVTATDLVKSVGSSNRRLVRPPGPKPWEQDFKSPAEGSVHQTDYGSYWCEPSGHYEYVECAPDFPVINPIANSLQCLKLNVDALWPKYEVIPFLLKILPRIKSLGHVNIVKGLKMIKGTLGFEGIKADTIEEMDFGYGGSLTCLSSANWADNEIGDYVEEIGHHLFDENVDNPEERREHLKQDIELVANQCPRLRRMEVYLFGDIPYLRESDAEVWHSFHKLTDLTEISLFAHEWSESVALVQEMGGQLRKLHLSLDGRGNMWQASNANYIPQLEDVLTLCPVVEDLTFSFGVKRLQVSPSFLTDDSVYRALRTFTVHTFMTKRAFCYLWSRAPNLSHIKVTSLSENDLFPQNGTPPAEFDEAEVGRLLRSNPMASLRKLDVLLNMKSIETAKVLIEGLPSVDVISTLAIKVGLPQEDYPNQEQMLLGLAHVMQAMRQFKMYCTDKASASAAANGGQQIRWKWERFGFLESFAEIEQLNALIEPNS